MNPGTKPTTKWKNSIFENIDDMFGTITGKLGPLTNDFNYLNIQLPTMEGFVESLYSTTSSSGVFTETMQTQSGDNPKNADKRNVGGVDPLTSEKHPEYANQNMVGLNAEETRVNTPPSATESEKSDDKKNTETFTGAYASEDTSATSNIEGFVLGSSEQEFSETDKKRKEFINAFQNLSKQPNIQNIKKVIVILFENIIEMFFIPEMIAIAIVRAGKDKDNELKHKLIVTKHLKSFAVVIISLYITLNWWYLWFYTDHAFNFEKIPEWGIFSPISLIVEPIISPLVFLNYYLIKQRLEPDFYENYSVRILDHKPFWLTLLFILINVMYPILIKLFSIVMKQVFIKTEDTSPLFYVIVMLFCIYSYIRNTVTNPERNIKIISALSFLFAIIFFLVLLVLVAVFAKFSVGFIFMFILFYSFWFLLWDKNIKIFEQMGIIISDSTIGCTADGVGEPWATIYRYLFIIAIYVMFLVHIIIAMDDIVKNVHNIPIQALTLTLYSCTLLLWSVLFGLISKYLSGGDIMKVEKIAILQPETLQQETLKPNE